MSNYVNYLVESNLCLLCFGLFYLFFISNETDFKFRRYYLIIISLLSLSAPLLKFGTAPSIGLGIFSEIPTRILPELVISLQSDLVASSPISASLFYLQWVYWAIAFIITQIFLFQLMQLVWFTFSKSTRVVKKKNYLLINTNGVLPTFSFFNLLFFDNTNQLTDQERERVIKHELTHIKQRHSLDIILMEIIKILFWFNPMVWYLRRETREVHEYLADDNVLKTVDKSGYSALLAKMALSQANISLGHHFSKSTTLKRIKMMNNKKRNVTTWKAITMVLMITFTTTIVSCNDEALKNEIASVDQSDVLNIVDKTATPEGGFTAYFEHLASQLKYPAQARKAGIEGKVYVRFIVNKDGSLSNVEVVKGIGAGCDEAARKAVAEAGISWSIPMQGGKAVRQRLILPITFKLDNDHNKLSNS